MAKLNKHLAEATRLLREAGAVLVSGQTTHWQWRLPNGTKVSISKSPSCRRGSLNKLKQVQRLLSGTRRKPQNKE